MSTLESLGYDRFFAAQFELIGDPELKVTRVSADGRDAFPLVGIETAVGELSGKLRHLAQTNRLARPIVGDWVTLIKRGERAFIQQVLDRRTLLVRRASGSDVHTQPIAANVDRYFIVTAPGEDFSQRRLERYLAAVWDCGASPVVVVNKTDRTDSLESLRKQVEAVALAAPIVMVSARTGAGMDGLESHLEFGLTAAFIGSSGVGKSSLMNRLLGHVVQPISEVDLTGRGRHTTTLRALFTLPNGSALIDTPGLREFGLLEQGAGLDAAFADIAALAQSCRYGDCTHSGEPECAVAMAAIDGTLPTARLESYLKLRREAAAAAARRAPAQVANSKKRWKSIHQQARTLAKNNPKYRDD